MAEKNKYKPKWRRVVRVAFRIYAGFCTLLVTAYIVLILGAYCLSMRPTPTPGEMQFAMSYGNYMLKEHPKRADHFAGLGVAMAKYAKEVSVAEGSPQIGGRGGQSGIGS